MANSKKLDWRRASEYDYIKLLSYKQLAWEFLRRSKIYCEYYDELQSAAKGKRDAKSTKILKRFKIKKLVAPDVTPLQSKESKTLFVVDRLVPHTPTKANGKRRIVISPVSATQVAIVFDLSVSIKKQVQAVPRRLNEQLTSMINRKKLIKPVRNIRSKDLYVRYFRVLDAKRAGASDDDIVKALSEDTRLGKRYSKDNLRKDKRLVKELVRAYRSIAFVN